MKTCVLTNTATKTNILIVDDRKENILTLQNIIDTEGRNILTAESGNEALKIIMQEPVDLALIDVQMPDMDGYEVVDLMRLNPRTKNIPVIFVSAVSKNEKLHTEKYEAGTVDFLFKPLDLEETRRRINWFEKHIQTLKENERLKTETVKLQDDFTRFTYLVTHDIKAPIRAIDNLTNWITEDMGDNLKPSVAENLSLLRNRVNRTQRMMNALSDFSRTTRIKESRQPVELNKLVHAVIESFSESELFNFTINGCDKTISVEKDLIQRVFTELIKNCIQHSEKESGEITISMEEMPDEYIFTIKDNGPGIIKQNEEKAFEIFQTLKSKDESENTGIGLPLVKRILENLNQRIWIDYSFTGGLCIKFSWNK
ncbi:MAG: hybrid sensor histidine kinase/response regulator [Bacteroidia bacterium]|nr:hybrid sensor histidine kinase/response regulator [Bacteroidia bacterium]